MARLYGTGDRTGHLVRAARGQSLPQCPTARYAARRWTRATTTGTSRGGSAAAVFGVSDGLVSNVALILGMAGAHASAGAVRLAGIAGLIAGSFSMAAGEYISMRAQSELMLRELDVERQAIRARPRDRTAGARRHLREPGHRRRHGQGAVGQDDARPRHRPRDPCPRGARHRPGQTGNPVQAAASSFVTFASARSCRCCRGCSPRAPRPSCGRWSSAPSAAFTVGAALAHFTGRSWLWSAYRQLLISGVAAGHHLLDRPPHRRRLSPGSALGRLDAAGQPTSARRGAVTRPRI